MAFVQAFRNRPGCSPIAHVISGVASWIANARAARNKRIALQTLLFAPEHCLRDLNIRRDELADVLNVTVGHRGTASWTFD